MPDRPCHPASLSVVLAHLFNSGKEALRPHPGPGLVRATASAQVPNTAKGTDWRLVDDPLGLYTKQPTALDFPGHRFRLPPSPSRFADVLLTREPARARDKQATTSGSNCVPLNGRCWVYPDDRRLDRRPLDEQNSTHTPSLHSPQPSHYGNDKVCS